MNAIWGFLLALFLALTGEYLAGVIAPALGLQKGAISGIMMAILLGILVNNLFKLPEFLRPGIKFSVVRILRLGIVLTPNEHPRHGVLGQVGFHLARVEDLDQH